MSGTLVGNLGSAITIIIGVLNPSERSNFGDRNSTPILWATACLVTGAWVRSDLDIELGRTRRMMKMESKTNG